MFLNLKYTRFVILFLLFIIAFISKAQKVGYVNDAAEAPSFKVNTYGSSQQSNNDIILIPGLMSDGGVWEVVIEELAKTSKVHVINIAGFASTAKVKEQSMVRVRQELLEYIKINKLDKPSIVGHSLGGFMAFWLASSYPDDIGAIISVDGLPFIGPVFTRTNSSTVESLKAQATQMQQHYYQMNSEQLANQTRQGIYIQATFKDAQNKIVSMASQSDPITVGDAIYTLMTNDLRESVSNIKSPTLLLGASGGFIREEDKKAVRTIYQEQISNIQGAKLVMNTQSRHFVMLDQPQWLIEQVTSFLGLTSIAKEH